MHCDVHALLTHPEFLGLPLGFVSRPTAVLPVDLSRFQSVWLLLPSHSHPSIPWPQNSAHNTLDTYCQSFLCTSFLLPIQGSLFMQYKLTHVRVFIYAKHTQHRQHSSLTWDNAVQQAVWLPHLLGSQDPKIPRADHTDHSLSKSPSSQMSRTMPLSMAQAQSPPPRYPACRDEYDQHGGQARTHAFLFLSLLTVQHFVHFGHNVSYKHLLKAY